MQTKQKSAVELALENESLLAENASLKEQLLLLSEQIAYLSRNLFGRKSERWMQPGQLNLFKKGAAAAECAAFKEKPAVKATPKKKGGHGRGSLPEHLERITHVLDLPEDEKCCSTCDTPLREIGEEITERAALIPARFVVNRYVRKKLACPHGHEIKTAALPDGVIQGSKYDASVHAHVAVAKYNDHMPLNRLEGIFKRHGIKLSRQTMWEMMLRIDELVAQPVLKQMRKELLEEQVLHADESPVIVRVEDEKKKTKQGWVWNWRNEPDYDSRKPPPDYKGRRSKALVEFHLGRGGEIPRSFLGDWSGALICDGHKDYSSVTTENGITRAGCWAHVRRPFREVVKQSPKWAALPFFLINRLFALERAILGRAKREEMKQEELLELRRVVRARSSKRLVDRIVKLADELRSEPSIVPQSKLGKGVGYILNQQSSLRAFLSDPRIPIHNNDSERDLRHVVTGRKAWMVFGSKRGGEVACRLFSLMLSCKQNGVNPEAYLAHVLMAVATTPSSQIASLTPWAFREARALPE